jgi:hypothetical protein
MKHLRHHLHAALCFTPLALGLMGSAQAATAVAKSAAAPRCMVAEIRGIAFSIHHPSERYVAITEWLNRNGPSCSLEKLQYINSNRPNWFGHSDSPALGQVLDQFIEIATGAPPKAPVVAADKDRSSLLAGTNRADAPPPVGAPAVAGQPPIIVAPVVTAPGGSGNKGTGAKP